MRTPAPTPARVVPHPARAPRPLALAALLALLPLAGGCLPTSVTFNFGDDSGIKSAVVGGDSTGPSVALIDVRGVLLDGPAPGLGGLLSSGRSPVAELAAKLRLAERDADVRAVIVRINSPGGGVAASETMYNEVRRFRQRSGKPVVACMTDVAASGGYYLALAADRIVAQPSGITGSIGVIVPTVNFSEGMRKVGIVARSIKSGGNKDLANPLEPVREGQYAVLQGIVDEFYARFRALVVERRRLDGTGRGEMSVDELTDGRVFTGSHAVRLGLADSPGDVLDALEEAKRLAGVPSARLLKYYRGREAPTTPLVMGDLDPIGPGQPRPTAAGDGTASFNLLQVNLDGLGGLGAPGGVAGHGGFFYLWPGP